jgi:hypothetical protein
MTKQSELEKKTNKKLAEQILKFLRKNRIATRKFCAMCGSRNNNVLYLARLGIARIPEKMLAIYNNLVELKSDNLTT